MSPTPTSGATPTPVPANGTALNGPLYGPGNVGWGPTAVANALQYPVQSGYNGANQTVAIIIDAYPTTNDLNAYATYFQTPQTNRTILVESIDGGPNGSDTSAEATLDTETIAGLAPGANVRVYGVPTLGTINVNDALNQIIVDGAAQVVSYSASSCEYAGQATTEAILATGANSGLSLVTSSGDQGNNCALNGSYAVGVGYPASDPNATGVGGTETYFGHYTLTSTTAWNDVTCGTPPAQCASGGGVSALVTIPSYQAGLPGIASSQYRNVPDLSMPAESTAIYFNGGWTYEAGTSWSAPLYAAMLAEVYEYCNTSFTKGPQLAYYVHGTAPSTTFIDVVSGNNQYLSTTPYFVAGAGYDNVSGLGVPLGMPFANTLCPNRVPALAPRRGDSEARLPEYHGDVVVDLRPALRALTDLGERNASERTPIQVVIRPGSDIATDEAAVIAALRAAGLAIDKQYPNHLVVDASGPTSAVEAYFSTRLHDFAQSRYGTRYAPVTTTTIPAAISSLVAGVVLDDVVTMSHHGDVSGDGVAQASPGKRARSQTP
jgi:subtilase family serine protease